MEDVGSRGCLDVTGSVHSGIRSLLSRCGAFRPSVDGVFLSKRPLCRRTVGFARLICSFSPGLPLGERLMSLPGGYGKYVVGAFPRRGSIFGGFLFLLGYFASCLRAFRSWLSLHMGNPDGGWPLSQRLLLYAPGFSSG